MEGILKKGCKCPVWNLSLGPFTLWAVIFLHHTQFLLAYRAKHSRPKLISIPFLQDRERNLQHKPQLCLLITDPLWGVMWSGTIPGRTPGGNSLQGGRIPLHTPQYVWIKTITASLSIEALCSYPIYRMDYPNIAWYFVLLFIVDNSVSPAGRTLFF